MNLIKKLLSHWLTARDGESYSFTKLIIGSAAGAMVYKFCESATPDYINFAGGIAALAAALAAKYYFEGKPAATPNAEGGQQ